MPCPRDCQSLVRRGRGKGTLYDEWQHTITRSVIRASGFLSLLSACVLLAFHIGDNQEDVER